MIIVGAGMAGLLAARMFSHRDPVIWERQKSLPNNHSAVLRFRTSQVGDILGIPFKKVAMIKDTAHWRNPIADSLAYSFKNLGSYRSDRSVTKGLVSEERFIAPPDFIARMARGVKIEFGREYDHLDPHAEGVPVISTMPMPAMVEHLNYDRAPDFNYREGWTLSATVNDCDAYVSLLVPNPDDPISRISLTGDQMIIELAREPVATPLGTAWSAARLLGIDNDHISNIGEPRKQTYNKIIPIEDEKRKEFMFWATKEFDIYSLGRYATWRPGLLLDDLVKDIRLIDGWIGRSGYHVAVRR